MRKRKYRQAAACFLTAALVLSAGPVQSVTPSQSQIPEALSKAEEAVRKVQELIDVLPTVDTLASMDTEEQQSAYEQAQAAHKAYEALPEEEQTQIDKTKIDALFAYFNSLTATADTSDTQTENSVAKVGNVYYDDLADALNNAKGQTCDILKDASLSGNYSFIGTSDRITINLNGHTINGSFTLILGGVYGSNLNGPGTINGNIGFVRAQLRAPLTVNGDVTDAGGGAFRVNGTGVFRVNGNIGYFSLGAVISDGVSIVCTGTCSEPEIQNIVITQPQNITLSVSPEGSGSVTATGNKVAMDSGSAIASAGSIVTLNAAANQGYRLKEWQVASGGVTITDNAFTMPENDVAVTAVFERTIETTVQLTIGGDISEGAADYGASLDLEAAVTGDNSPVNGGTVDFYLDEVGEANKLNPAGIEVKNGTAKFPGCQITGDRWKPSNTPHTILAVYTPESGSNLLGSTATAPLTVNKATAPASSAPENTSKIDDTMVELAAASGDPAYGNIEYGYTTGGETSVPEERWQEETVFDGLQPVTSYTFYTRYAGNDYYEPSPASGGLTVTTAKSDTVLENLEVSGQTGFEGHFQYGDIITVTFTPERKAEINTNALAENTATLTYTPAEGETVTLATANAQTDGSFKLTYDTKKKELPIGENLSLTISYGGGSTLNPVEETVTLSLDKAYLKNMPTVTGSFVYNGTLTLNYTPQDDETVTYQWWRIIDDSDTERIDGATGETYTLTESEIGESIYVIVSATDEWHRGAKQSDQYKITKASQSVPTAKEGCIIDYEAETVTALEGYELSASDNESAVGSEKLPVTPGTDIYIRKAETQVYFASDWAAVDIPERPALTLKASNISADGFTVTVDGQPADAVLTYRAAGTDGEYSYDSGEQTSGTFTGLKAGVTYQVSVKCAAGSGSFSAEANITVPTNGASYTVSIPGKATAGGEPVSISITEDSEHPFDLGYQGEVNVRIKDEGNIKNGSLTLTREGSANTVTSALYVGDTLFTDLNQNVATFTEDNKDTSVALSFAAPEEPYIPAGTYQGTVNFEISYTQ